MRRQAAIAGLAIGLWAGPGAGSGGACTPALLQDKSVQLAAGHWQLAFALEPREVAVGQPFAIEVAVCAVAGARLPERLKVDATMPEHRHGMNYAPTVTRRGPGRFRAEGLMLHMPGRWQLAFELAGSGEARLATHDLVLP